MDILISINGIDVPKTNRQYKGKSIIDFPESYCVVDIETTGLSPEWDNIIEIGAIKVQKEQEIDRFQSLIQPPADVQGEYVDEFISDLTGITNEMLANAPKIDNVIDEFSKFLSDSTVVGYNVGFDINFLYDDFEKYINKYLSNNYIDVMRMARKLYPGMQHHRLKDMISFYEINNENEHRALSDCEATEKCFLKLHDEAIKQYETDEKFIKSYIHHYQQTDHTVKAANIQTDGTKIDPDNPLYQKHCVFTGKLEKFTRHEAMQIVADLGGINEDGVTKNTNFLILGNNDYCVTIKDGKSSKQKKAEKNKLNGQDIEIISETVFYDMLGD